MPQVSTAKRLAKNTFFMYFRMAFLMIIALYTSRVVLEKLGVEDYGIYNVVGSLVAIFTSLRSLFSVSSQRFLSTDMGRGDESNLNKTYNHSLYINSFFALFVIIVAEIVGYWFFNGHINVDESRLAAAKWVFHFSVLSSATIVFTSSFEALCIAHEKMSFYAYISIFEGLLQLGVVFLLSISPIDALVFYGLLKLGIAVLILLVNYTYCKRSFAECYFCNCFDKHYLKKMLSFSGWSFLGSTSYTLTQQGMNMVLNIFGGPIVNAARGIAYQVNSAINQFMSNIVVAIRPYCIKTYAEGNSKKTFDLLFIFTKISFCIQFCLIIPIVFLTPKILDLWLGQVPEYSVIFVQLVLTNTLVRTFHPAVDLLFMANGKLKRYQITEGFFLLMPLVTSYFLLKGGLPYYSAFISIIVFECINFIAISFVAKKEAEFPVARFTKEVLLHCVICVILGVVLFQLSSKSYEVWQKLLYAICSICLGCAYMLLFCFKKYEIKQLKALKRKPND
jgi:O-antigen/teichoic acid export membrane protein